MLVAIRSMDDRRTHTMMRGASPLIGPRMRRSPIRRSTRELKSSRENLRSAMPGKMASVVSSLRTVSTSGRSSILEKQPYAIATAEDGRMVMAGLWVMSKDPKSGKEVQSCTILTTHSNDVMGRMPIILAEKDWASLRKKSRER
jgi:putative SOS response-associated peptidase YedK